MNAQTENLRFHLRGATADAHDLLDRAMRAASGWTSLDDYARFLSLQYAARQPVERWLENNAPRHLTPPPQCHLIARDLAALDRSLPVTKGAFTAASGPGEALGIAWVLAGSALGNRSILKEVRRTADTLGIDKWPDAFLADPAMLAFWNDLRRVIERPAPLEEMTAASAAAAGVFDHFLAATQPDERGPDQLAPAGHGDMR